MTLDELTKIQQTIQESIGASGIKEMREAFIKHIQDDAITDEMIKTHIVEMQPVKKLGETMIGMGRGTAYMAGIGVGLAGIIAAFVEIFKNVKK